ncbi:hypothetical protein GCM10009113_07460 [Marinobacter szutsaonensis]
MLIYAYWSLSCMRIQGTAGKAAAYTTPCDKEGFDYKNDWRTRQWWSLVDSGHLRSGQANSVKFIDTQSGQHASALACPFLRGGLRDLQLGPTMNSQQRLG